ncbi:hypothetical protein EYF80_044117 [Liparis tanakae]|uniref:Uncharacterized protein n=1 Tax=Liparis tanakae TaxID=230148 RepID=A0A4Z2FWM9_9TELE|nr:hypothetical protein EYF80_044117 [Liparis tanakae]
MGTSGSAQGLNRSEGARRGGKETSVTSLEEVKALAEQTPEQPLAVLTHRGPRVRVHGERVRHLHLAHQDLVQVDRPARVEAPRVAGGPRLAEQKDHQLHFVWVEVVPKLYTESVVERRSDWLLLSEVVDRRRLRAPLQLFGMLNAQRLW